MLGEIWERGKNLALLIGLCLSHLSPYSDKGKQVNAFKQPHACWLIKHNNKNVCVNVLNVKSTLTLFTFFIQVPGLIVNS